MKAGSWENVSNLTKNDDGSYPYVGTRATECLFDVLDDNDEGALLTLPVLKQIRDISKLISVTLTLLSDCELIRVCYVFTPIDFMSHNHASKLTNFSQKKQTIYTDVTT